jgi:hypothetical protein
MDISRTFGTRISGYNREKRTVTAGIFGSFHRITELELLRDFLAGEQYPARLSVDLMTAKIRVKDIVPMTESATGK